MAEPMDEFDVAVVVYCRTTAPDMADAEDRAVAAVRHSLANFHRPAMPLTIVLPKPMRERLDAEPVTVAAVRGLRYSQGIVMQPGAEPYHMAGMEPPKKADGA